ncbi:MAG TPA: molybdopterin-synthase adenylyltransferase MoeB [Vicinamibacterales bacterium]|nr:molybdopterin-synthase adenylyltransferase MoeB [Vicinamibacterales bacterium]
MPLADLSTRERQRYSRHILLPQIGEDGQQRLKAARVLCVGAGGLGSPALLYLAAAGVGTIGLVDFDVVDFTNLQRQVVHDTASVGRPKVESARERIAALNPDVRVEAFNTSFSVANAKILLDDFDLVIDGTDNFPARYLVNDACVLYRKPNAWGSIFRFEGQAAVFGAPGGPCYRCLHPEPPPADVIPNCAEAGVLGVLPGIIGTIQATEAIKLILGIGEPLVGKLLVLDALKMRFRELKLPKDPECPMCGARPAITELREISAYCEREDSPLSPRALGTASEMTVSELKVRIDAGNAPVILDVREPHEAAICRIPGSKTIPLGELPQRLIELDAGVELVVLCKSGARSARAVDLLRDAGFANVTNLSGGILCWINEIDPSLARY